MRQIKLELSQVDLGNTGIKVSKICYGALTMSPLQMDFSFERGAELLYYAFQKGINFLDTADYYDNYGHIKEFLKQIPSRENYVIGTKSYAYSTETAKQTLDRALNEMQTDYVDLFLLHEQESDATIRGHYEAIEYLLKKKEEGLIRAVGISTHFIEAVNASIDYPELEVVMPIINKSGIGIVDGSRLEMERAIASAKGSGKAIYAMKPFGGGHLISDAVNSFNYVNDLKTIDSIAIGMQSEAEIDANCQLINLGYIEDETFSRLDLKSRKLHIADWCIGCGNCVKACQQNALKLINHKAIVDENKCVKCGYCARRCPEFCIKVY